MQVVLLVESYLTYMFKFAKNKLLLNKSLIKMYCNMHACLRPLLSNGPSQQVNSGDAC
jgi:hypothetical protein